MVSTDQRQAVADDGLVIEMVDNSEFRAKYEDPNFSSEIMDLRSLTAQTVLLELFDASTGMKSLVGSVGGIARRPSRVRSGESQ